MNYIINLSMIILNRHKYRQNVILKRIPLGKRKKAKYCMTK